jgi:hypothetical protein
MLSLTQIFVVLNCWQIESITSHSILADSQFKLIIPIFVSTNLNQEFSYNLCC